MRISDRSSDVCSSDLDAAAGHHECVHRTALVELAHRAARHDEFVDALALLHLAGDGSGADREAVVAIALVDRALDPAGIDDDDVGAVAEADVARDGAGAAGDRKSTRLNSSH